ncbi:periplasmic binding protein [Porphyromonas uenonis 60-3]|uniref:Periplasmic binding protein n=1 Tax=Porphyromonas uenonis 60-3 TaxID=596327 RepID=C2MCT0_9PORP|nr:helical backbone metal receptor [Porphyromonas uenonis]EEK16446.1 periplasmic binding protein [Porphyromonas uenonis 60-3]
MNALTHSLRRPLLRFLPLLLLLPFLVGCHKASQQEDEAQAPRIVSLVPSVSDQLYDLGCDSLLVGCTSYCSRAVADSVTVVGSAIQTNLELLIAQRPTLVFASDFTAPQTISALENAGIQVIQFTNPASYDAIQAQYRQIATLVGASDRAEAQLAEINQRVDWLKELNAARPWHPRAFMQIAFDPLFGASTSTYMNDLITFSGCTNIVTMAGNGQLSLEYVVEQDPEVLFLITNHGSESGSEESWHKLRSVTAVQQGDYCPLPGSIVSQPSPQHFVEALQLMTDYLSE